MQSIPVPSEETPGRSSLTADFAPSCTEELGQPNAQGASLQMAELLGSGRHGVVMRALHGNKSEPTNVAVKIPSGAGSLRHEAIALRRFAHANVVEVLDGPMANGSLILEHCDLGTVARRIEERPLSPTEVDILLNAMIQAISPIHDAGWVHGDISPSNIGLRSEAAPALFDFATARPADGTAVDEGTAEFAGPLRQADPRLDIRCLAATGLACIDPLDPGVEAHRAHLQMIIERCERGEDVSLAEVHLDPDPANLRREGETARIGGSLSQALPVDGHEQPERPITRTFGPRPSEDDAAIPNDAGEKFERLPRWGALLIVAILMVLAGTELFDGDLIGGRHQVEVTTPEQHLSHHLTAAETLLEASAQWDGESGVLSLARSDGEQVRLAAGQAGDIPAIADWNCDGLATLGVFRPLTGNWFVFESWEIAAASSVASLEPSGNRATPSLDVLVDVNGCATPSLD